MSNIVLRQRKTKIHRGGLWPILMGLSQKPFPAFCRRKEVSMDNSSHPIASAEQTLTFFGYRDMSDGLKDWQKLSHDEQKYFRLEVGNELAGRKFLPAPQP